MFDENALKKFYADISTGKGVSIEDFQNRLESLFSDDRSAGDLNKYRLGRRPWKKLRDEITPVSRFLRFNDIEMDRIRFPLDSNTPDCWLLKKGADDLGIEVTIERGRERFHRTREMIETGIGRGFVGVQDNAPQEDFDRRMSHSRTMYSTEQALNARGIAYEDFRINEKGTDGVLNGVDLTGGKRRWKNLRPVLSVCLIRARAMCVMIYSRC